jgi:acyl-CoA reductase-like NAD-dependent aldehyde dehydrogenase/gamma-glutamyl-gamma-aminobutyrate hydrolase PuuD
MKKRIGISYSELAFDNYWNWFTPEDLGDDTELCLLSFEKGNREDIPTCDGFLLTGGVDVHPTYYGGDEDYPNRPESHLSERDYFEAAIYHYAKMHRLPVLGICRGLQLVNVLEGGELIQDLGGDNKIHKKEGSSDKHHRVVVQPGTLLHEVMQVSSGHVNSAHHQAVHPDAVAPTLMVNAFADDQRVIEGLEYRDKKDKPFLLCVQWHPERMDGRERNPFSKNLKAHFLEEVRRTNMEKIEVINPATAEMIAHLNADNAQTLSEKFALLKKGQTQWRALPLEKRVEKLHAFAGLLKENIESLAVTLTAEVGKPLQQSRNEINGACTRINWLTANAAKYLSDEWMTDEEGLKEQIRYEPLGIVCNISAWNYPYLVGVNVFVSALLGGNAVLYKPSEYASLTGLQIEKLLKKAGVHEYVFQVGIGGAAVGEQLLELPFDGYFFTGSHRTGKYIYERVARKMVPCQCELGGKDPLYVADDVADITAVAAATADGAFYNNGQSCCAVERIYVHRNIYDEYIKAFVNEVKGFKTGMPTDEGVYVGPLSRKQQVQVLEAQVADAVHKGASVLAGGKAGGGKGFYFEPTVLADVNHDMAVMRDESFGPVIGIMKVDSDEEALRLMQDTDYGLTAAVYSNDQNRAQAILEQMDTGTVYWNCCDRVSAALPWSGRKHSGFGATLSHTGLRAFVRPKAYHLKK